MAGYIRTGVGVEDNIADGLTINAADFNAEYDAIEVAFGTAGHTHDGTAGNGPVITAVGPSLAYEFNANAIQPKSGQTSLDLGTTGLRFDNAFLTTTNTNNLTVNTATTLTGTVNIGSVSLEEYIEDITGGNLTAGTGIAVAYNDTAGTGTVSLSHLGLQSLTDPNADRIAFWDDSGSTFNWLSLGTAISISDTTLNIANVTTSVSGLMSAADKTKLNGIEAGAEVNESSFKTISVSGQDDVVADSDADSLTLVAGSNVTLTTNATNDSVTITSTDTNTTYSVGDGGLTQNNFTNTLKTKLDGLEASDYATAAQGTTADAALPKGGGAMTGNITFAGTHTVDGRDLSIDGSKLDGIESNATADQTGAQIKTAYEGESDTNAFTDAEKTKLSNIDANAQTVTTSNVTAAGAVMDSELASEAAVKAINQQLTTTSSPSFTAVSTDTISTDTINEKTSNNGVSIDGVTIKDGDIVLSSSKSLDFSDNVDTTSQTGTNVHTEKFSKFEQGTFTPYLYGDTESGDVANSYMWKDGFYQRIGDFVHLHIMIRISSKKSISSGNQIEIKGLPFQHYSTGQTMPLVMMPVIGVNLGTGFTGMNIKGTIANASTIPGILLWYNTTAAPTTWSRLRLSMLANGCMLNLQTTHLLGTIN